jgi:hypothetical protein
MAMAAHTGTKAIPQTANMKKMPRSRETTKLLKPTNVAAKCSIYAKKNL